MGGCRERQRGRTERCKEPRSNLERVLGEGVVDVEGKRRGQEGQGRNVGKRRPYWREREARATRGKPRLRDQPKRDEPDESMPPIPSTCARRSVWHLRVAGGRQRGAPEPASTQKVCVPGKCSHEQWLPGANCEAAWGLVLAIRPGHGRPLIPVWPVQPVGGGGVEREGEEEEGGGGRQCHGGRGEGSKPHRRACNPPPQCASLTWWEREVVDGRVWPHA